MIRTLQIWLLFCLAFMNGALLCAQENSPFIEISFKGKTKYFKNYKTFDFEDSAKNHHHGKIYILNDTQFCFVNFFNERSSKTYHISEIYGICHYETNRRRFPLGVKIFLSLMVPYVGLPYLIISELVRKKDKNPIKGGSIWYYRPDINVQIRGFAVEI